jgi:periplasmic divalent cation tolerance protein
MNFFVVYMTASDRDEARRIADALVSERLAACVNILGEMESHYWWEGSVKKDGEVALLAKTTEERVSELTTRVASMHSYDCPCIVSIPLAHLHEPFARWIGDQLSTRSQEEVEEGEDG